MHIDANSGNKKDDLTAIPQEWINLIFSHTVANSKKKNDDLKLFGWAWWNCT